MDTIQALAKPASGVALGTAGLKFAEALPLILQYANLLLVIVSVTVGILTIWQKARQIRDENDNSRIQRKLLRRMGVDPDSDTDSAGL